MFLENSVFHFVWAYCIRPSYCNAPASHSPRMGVLHTPISHTPHHQGRMQFATTRIDECRALFIKGECYSPLRKSTNNRENPLDFINFEHKSNFQLKWNHQKNIS